MTRDSARRGPGGALAPTAAAQDDPLDALLDCGVLAAIDALAARTAGELVHETDPQVLLAAALAVRAPRVGHVLVDLAALEPGDLLGEDDDEPDLPAELDAPAGLDAGPLRARSELGRPPFGRSAQPGPRASLRAGPSPADAATWEATRRVVVTRALPRDRAAWRARVAASPLVHALGDAPAPFVLAGDRLYTARYHDHERRLAAALLARAGRARAPADAALLRRGLAVPFHAGPAPAPGRPPARAPELDRQRLAVALSQLGRVTVISGGPGTGKTTAVKAVLALARAQWWARGGPAQGPLRVAVAAPTGKAAARIGESIRSGLGPFLDAWSGALGPGGSRDDLAAFLTGLEPRTLHRLLGSDPSRPTRFRRDAKRPLEHELVIVDEASMVDLALFARLLDAVRPEAALVLLGDANQLASVEAGSVLADLCGPRRQGRLALSPPLARRLADEAGLEVPPAHVAAGTPALGDAIVLLERVHRFGAESGIGAFARACVAEPPRLDDALAVLTDPAYPDVTLREPPARGPLPADLQALVVAGFRPYLERLRAGPAPGETEEQHHLAVLSLLDGFRVLCAHRRGPLGRSGMNAWIERALRGAAAGFEPRAGFYPGRPILVTRNDYVTGRMNGDVGVVVTHAAHGLTVAFAGARGQVEYLAPARLPAHETVFAMTIHKAQGSEVGHALVVLPLEPSPLLTRELVYTAVTRAKERATVLARPAVLRHALSRTVRRATGLEAALWGG